MSISISHLLNSSKFEKVRKMKCENAQNSRFSCHGYKSPSSSSDNYQNNPTNSYKLSRLFDAKILFLLVSESLHLSSKEVIYYALKKKKKKGQRKRPDFSFICC